jgi:hypothetical protein
MTALVEIHPMKFRLTCSRAPPAPRQEDELRARMSQSGAPDASGQWVPKCCDLV